MKPRFFRSPVAFRRWLAANHAKAAELEVGYHKRDSGKGGMTYHESVDEALCFGWIDGVRHRIDDASYRIRFTPRRPGSIWSAINLRKIRQLTAEGRMAAAGLAAHRKRDPRKAGLYSFENRPKALTPAQRAEFKRSPKAWAYYQAQPPWYRRVTAWWVRQGKKEETRERRLATLIATSKKGQWLPQLKY